MTAKNVGAPLVGALNEISEAGTRPAPTLIEEIQDLQQKGLYRKLRTLSDIKGTHARLNGKEIILFCGNDYLGLSQHPQVVGAAREALLSYGAGAGAARLISGTSDLHTQLEKELARFKGKEAALIFGSGYLTNLGVLSALAGEKDLIVMDKLCHASLIDGARLSGATLRVFPHKDYERCDEILEICRGRPRACPGGYKTRPYRRVLLVSDSVFSMDGDLADLEELVRIKEKFGALLVLDEAHGIGVFGEKGEGVARGEILQKIDIVAGTLSKAFGVFGGFAVCSNSLKEHLINFSRPFIFATAPPAALMAGALKALELIEKESGLREKLWDNMGKVDQFLGSKRAMTVVSPIFPIMVGDEKEAVRISESLLEHGILIPAIRYPTVAKGKARLRLTLSAAHTEEDLEKLFKALNSVIARQRSK